MFYKCHATLDDAFVGMSFVKQIVSMVSECLVSPTVKKPLCLTIMLINLAWEDFGATKDSYLTEI